MRHALTESSGPARELSVGPGFDGELLQGCELGDISGEEPPLSSAAFSPTVLSKNQSAKEPKQSKPSAIQPPTLTAAFSQLRHVTSLMLSVSEKSAKKSAER